MAYKTTLKAATKAPEKSNGKAAGQKPLLEKTKKVSYTTTSDQIFALAEDASASATAELLPSKVEVENTGKIPLSIMVGYETYSTDTADGDTEYLHTMLLPNEVYSPALRAVIATGADKGLVDGTVVSSTAPNANMYTDSTADVDSATAAGIVGHATSPDLDLEPYTSAANCTANLFRVGDLVRVRDEVMEVTAIGDKSDLANNKLTVKRDMYGTDGGTSAVDDDPVRFPFFNAYHNYNKYSVAQTDTDGKFKCTNFFGLGRTLTGVQGITAGSIAIKFYEAGYQEFGLSGITSTTNSGLSASTTYYLSVSIDGATTDKITFTTDSSNVNFGGKNGIVSKLQASIDALYYNPAKNGFQKGATVSITNGDVRVTSAQHLSTSAISITTNTDGTSGTDELFDTSNAIGRIPATIKTAVAARLPDDYVYDPVTYRQVPNESKFVYDDGFGNLFGAATGSINYETGAIDFRNAPANAEFVYSLMHTSAFSGKVNPSTSDRINSLVDIYANTTNQRKEGEVKVRTF